MIIADKAQMYLRFPRMEIKHIDISKDTGEYYINSPSPCCLRFMRIYRTQKGLKQYTQMQGRYRWTFQCSNCNKFCKLR
jgi:hypothetical protein